MNQIEVLREIDGRLGGNCRVNVTVGGAVGTAPNEEPIEPETSVLSVFIGDTVYIFTVDDDSWLEPEITVDTVVRHIAAEQGDT